MSALRLMNVMSCAVLLLSCGDRRVSPIASGYFYASSGGKLPDSMPAKNLEYKRADGKFVIIYENILTGHEPSVLVHNGMVVFYAYPGKYKSFQNAALFAANPDAKPVNIAPAIYPKINELALPEDVDLWKWYGVSDIKDDGHALRVELLCFRRNSSVPPEISIEVAWTDIEALLKQR